MRCLPKQHRKLELDGVGVVFVTGKDSSKGFSKLGTYEISNPLSEWKPDEGLLSSNFDES